MLLAREKKILNLLLKNEKKKFTISQIAAELNVSQRTIKMDIKKINGELNLNSCCIRTKRGVGVWLDCDEEGKNYLKMEIYAEHDSYISTKVRKYYIAVLILNSEGFVSMEAIANRIYVSKGSVVNDVSELNSFWKKFGITLVKKVKYGIRVLGTEKQIRQAFIEALKKTAGTMEKFEAVKKQLLSAEIMTEQLKSVIFETEKRFHFVLTEISFHEFFIQIVVMLERVSKGFTLEDGWRGQQPGEKAWYIGSYLREQLERATQTKIPDTENCYLVMCLKSQRFQVPMEKDKKGKQENELQMFDYMVEILREIDEKYHLDIAGDTALVCAMFDHLEIMLHRIQSKLFIMNPILESVKKEMFYEYEIATYFIARFQKKYKIEATESEIGYIAFHIGAAIERKARKRKRVISATIVCMTGIGTSQFLSAKLQRVFPDLKIQKIIPGNMAENLAGHREDVVISTVPLNLDRVDVIHISPVLNEEDMGRIRKYLLAKENQFPEMDSRYQSLKGLIHEEITVLSCDLKSKEEVIELLGGRMCREGYADEGYVGSVFDRESISDTSVGNSVAIPHAFGGHILKQGIGLMTLQKPIAWGEEKVQLIFMLALNPNGEINVQDIFGELLDLTKDYKSIENILKARKYSEIEILKK